MKLVHSNENNSEVSSGLVTHFEIVKRFKRNECKAYKRSPIFFIGSKPHIVHQIYANWNDGHGFEIRAMSEDMSRILKTNGRSGKEFKVELGFEWNWLRFWHIGENLLLIRIGNYWSDFFVLDLETYDDSQ